MLNSHTMQRWVLFVRGSFFEMCVLRTHACKPTGIALYTHIQTFKVRVCKFLLLIPDAGLWNQCLQLKATDTTSGGNWQLCSKWGCADDLRATSHVPTVVLLRLWPQNCSAWHSQCPLPCLHQQELAMPLMKFPLKFVCHCGSGASERC